MKSSSQFKLRFVDNALCKPIWKAENGKQILHARFIQRECLCSFWWPPRAIDNGTTKTDREPREFHYLLFLQQLVNLFAYLWAFCPAFGVVTRMYNEHKVMGINIRIYVNVYVPMTKWKAEGLIYCDWKLTIKENYRIFLGRYWKCVQH